MRPASPPGAAPFEAEQSEIPTMSGTSDQPANGSSAAPDGASERRSRWLRWALLGGLQLVALAAAVAFIATYQGRAHEATVPPGAAPAPEFAHSFTFPVTVTAVPVVPGGSTRAAAAVAASVQKALSGFYSSAFLDPAAWTGRLPSDA